MSTATDSSPKFSSETDTDDLIRSIVNRLLFVVGATLFCWLILAIVIYTTSFPVLPSPVEGQPPEAASMLSVRFAAGILITHFVSTFCIQTFAPASIVRERLFSNSMLSALVLALCFSITLVAPVLPPDAVPYIKQATIIAFHPAFIVANFLLTAATGLLMYWYREIRIMDIIEIYWGLGVMFLLGLATALTIAVAAA